MQFRVVPPTGGPAQVEPDVFYLVEDSWDDWFKYQTTFSALYVDKDSTRHHIGQVKIGRFGLQPASAGSEAREGYRRPNVPTNFDVLPPIFFSLGQDTSYYEALESLGATFRGRVLSSLRDVAYDHDLWVEARSEDVMKVSLLREVPVLTVEEQFSRLARGGALLTSYKFSFRTPSRGNDGLALGFSVQPNSWPPSNIHVLIGRNGVGKSTLLHQLANAFVQRSARSTKESPESKPAPTTTIDISNLVSVSFSAFDAFEPITVSRDRTKGLSYHYVGLKKVSPEKGESATKDQAALSRELTTSARTCLQGASRSRWLSALRLLENDPVFADVGLSYLIEDEDAAIEEILGQLTDIFRKLSSGHKLVLLTITRLVETVVEKTLTLIDEPEAHLHPPLLSAFIRALSSLLTNRNGMAIIATHSPVVLQEVPRSCVWKLHRSGSALSAERPQIETFGENVGTLTDEVFGLEVTSTGFHRMLSDAAQKYQDYDEALQAFNNQLGAEGRAILRSRVAALASRKENVDR